MKRTPIIAPAQVYLNTSLNEYAVVMKANRSEIQFAGQGFYGKHEAKLFLERFSPVDPIDLTEQETQDLTSLLAVRFSGTNMPEKLLIGWIEPEDDDLDYDEEEN
jgi:hypothetical protein